MELCNNPVILDISLSENNEDLRTQKYFSKIASGILDGMIAI